MNTAPRVALQSTSALMTVLFALSAWVQLNDPDPLAWILLYLGAALLSATALWRPLRIPSLLWGLGAFAWLATLTPALARVQWSRWVDDEIAREAGGLLIVAGWMIAIALWGHHAQKSARPLT